MFASDLPDNGGIGNAVRGGVVATGVFPADDVRLSGTLLQAENKTTLARQKTDRQRILSLVFIVMVVGRRQFFNLIFGE